MFFNLFVFFKCLNMCNVPPKFYQVCRLCLSCPTDDSQCAADKEDVKNVNLSIFDTDITESETRNIPHKIMTCLSILVGDSLQCYPSLTSFFLHIHIPTHTSIGGV